MHIFDMLELLETEIVSLRAQNRQLRLRLDQQSANGKHPSERSKGRKRASEAKKKAKRRSAGPSGKTKVNGIDTATEKGEQMESPIVAGSGESKPEPRSVGKRQALGKSLLQLRKTAAPRQL